MEGALAKVGGALSLCRRPGDKKTDLVQIEDGKGGSRASPGEGADMHEAACKGRARP